MTKHFSSSRAGRFKFRGTMQGLLAASVVGLGVAGVLTQTDQVALIETAQAQEPPQQDTLDAETYHAIDRLRSELGLTHRDLCAAGCDTAAAHGALTTLLSWYEANKSSLYSARNAVLAARKNLYEASRASGDSPPGRLDALTQAVADARAALAQVHAQAVVRAESAMTQGQRQRLAAGRANTGIPGSLRYVHGLSDTQKQSITGAQTARSTPAKVLSAAGLSGSQQQELNAVQAASEQYGLQVAAGEAAALPVPQSIHAEREAEAALPVTQ